MKYNWFLAVCQTKQAISRHHLRLWKTVSGVCLYSLIFNRPSDWFWPINVQREAEIKAKMREIETTLEWGGGTGGMSAAHVFCGPSVCDCQGLKMDRNKSITLHRTAWRQTRSHTSSLFLLSSSFAPSWVSTQPKQQKKKNTFPFPFGYFCCMLFTSPALWCNPSGVSDWR